MSEEDKKFNVLIDDNYHYHDGTSPTPGGSFGSYAQAVRAAEKIVDTSLAEFYEKGMSADELCKQYTSFGDDPYIIPNDNDHPRFSARTYASEQYSIICKGQ